MNITDEMAQLAVDVFFDCTDPDVPSMRLALEAVYPAIAAAEREECAKIAENTFRRGSAHTYASENADVYYAQEDAAERIAVNIRALKD